jgi:hypothetical protein
MKYLIMCEGPNELEIIKILLRHNCLKFTEDDLLGLVPYHARQIKRLNQNKKPNLLQKKMLNADEDHTRMTRHFIQNIMVKIPNCLSRVLRSILE